MKHIINYTFLLLFVGLFACTSDEFTIEENPSLHRDEITQIKATTSSFLTDDISSRANVSMGGYGNFGLVTWAEGDTIGIYPSKGDQLSFPIVHGIGSNVCEFNGGGWALKTSTTYTAYTPFNRSYYLYMKNDALPVSMLGQKQIGNNSSKHLGAYDLQIARDKAPASGLISFTFNHQVAFVRMDLTAPCNANWKSITLESTAAFTTKAQMNLSADIITLKATEQSNSVTLNLQDVSTKDSLHIVAYMMMLPVDLTNKTLNIKLEDTDSNIYMAPATILNGVKNFKAGTAKWITAEFEESTGTEDIPYVTFTAEATQSLSMSQEVKTLEYSVNGGEWKTLGTATVGFGGGLGRLRLRGKNYQGTNGSRISFGNVAPVACSGDIRTLIDYEAYKTVYTGYAAFNELFRGCSQLTSAPVLPATTLAESCYSSMFARCSSLTEAPVLPATTLAQSCYSGMFSGCSSLTEAPALPATTLAQSCYSGMFSGCSSLTEAPALPATTLASYCYDNMFYGCSSLTEAPALPATTLASYCYDNMFYGCSSLTEAPALPATTLASYCYDYMFYGCSSLTEAPALPATTLASYCYDYMFYGCSSLTEAPALPATTLAQSCYSGMFSGCSSLTEAPALPATTLASYCYDNMFSGCSSLTEAPALPATTLAQSCYYGMFSGCSSLTEAPALPATTLASYCYDNMFSGCSSLTEAPALPATTLDERCYHGMFSYCSSLTEAPALPATTLASYCYSNMFSGCSSLTEAPALPATTLASYCYDYMFSNCSSLTEAPALPATTLAERCYRGMFSDCSSLKEVTMLATDISANECLKKWLTRVSSSGTFIKSPEMTALRSGSSGIPEGWTIVDYEDDGNVENPKEGEESGW